MARIAIVVDSIGQYNAVGWEGATDEDMIQNLEESMDDDYPIVARYFIDVELPKMKPMELPSVRIENSK